MAKGKYTVVVKNKPIASQLKAYEARERGYSLIEKELERRFAGLDWRYQKRIIVDFIQGNRSNREWVMPKLLDIWDKSFEPLVKEAWEKYHEERCSWVVIRQMPEEYVLSQIDELVAIGGNYKFICCKLAKREGFKVDMRKLDWRDFPMLLHNVAFSDEEMFEIFLRMAYGESVRLFFELYYVEEGEVPYNMSYLITRGGCANPQDMSAYKTVKRHASPVAVKMMDGWCNGILCSEMSDWDSIRDDVWSGDDKEIFVVLVMIRQIRLDLQRRLGFLRDEIDDRIDDCLSGYMPIAEALRRWEKKAVTPKQREQQYEEERKWVYGDVNRQHVVELFKKENSRLESLMDMLEGDDNAEIVMENEVPF